MLGASDCERIGDGWLAQPANALSGLGLVAAGMWILLRARAGGNGAGSLLGAAMIAAGAGSFLYHGPMPAGARYLHDVTAVALGVTLAAVLAARAPLRAATPATLGAVAAVAVPPAVWPRGGGVLIAVAAGVAVVAAALAMRSGRLSPAMALAAAGTALAAGVLLVLGRTGGPLCDPATPLQAHAGWHLLMAGTVTVLGAAAVPGRTPR